MELPVIGWRLWYSDSTFSSEDGTWDEAPSTDVQALEVFHEAPYRTLTYGDDVYRLTPDSTPKQGGRMDDAAFDALVTQVVSRA